MQTFGRLFQSCKNDVLYKCTFLTFSKSEILQWYSIGKVHIGMGLRWWKYFLMWNNKMTAISLIYFKQKILFSVCTLDIASFLSLWQLLAWIYHNYCIGRKTCEIYHNVVFKKLFGRKFDWSLKKFVEYITMQWVILLSENVIG